MTFTYTPNEGELADVKLTVDVAFAPGRRATLEDPGYDAGIDRLDVVGVAWEQWAPYFDEIADAAERENTWRADY